jgi:hypothetical protein
MRLYNRLGTTCLLAGVLFAFPLSAAELRDGTPPADAGNQPSLKQGEDVPQEARAAEEEKREKIRSWNLSQLQNGWLGSRLMDARVEGRDGREIGEMRNIIIGHDAGIDSIILQAGGFLGMGENHVRVPWKDVTVHPSLERVTVPLSKDNIDQFRLFGEDTKPPQERSYRFTELTRTYATLGNGEGYGFVEDLIFSQRGELIAVVTQPTGGFEGRGSHFAFPYDPEAYSRDRGVWRFPFSRDEVAVMEPYEIKR